MRCCVSREFLRLFLRAMSNDSTIPATLWRDHADAETRAFYGNLNDKTRRYLAAFDGNASSNA